MIRVVAGVVVLVVGGGALAYNLMGVRWDDDAIPVPYGVNQTLSGDVSDGEALEAIQMGFHAWDVLPCSFMRWDPAGRTDNDRWGSADGENTVVWRDSGWGSSGGALAITMTNWGGGGRLSDSDIKFNGVHHDWAHFRDDPGGSDHRTDIAAVATHEVGHALGLDHTGVRGSTMWPSVSSGRIGSRTLGEDDIAGVCAVYPTGEPAPAPEDLPPPSAGSADFGEDCTSDRCGAELVCVTDGVSRYCSRFCETSCDGGYHCVDLADDRRACARGPDPDRERADVGQPCDARGCRSGLLCVRDQGEAYCVAPCEDGCPEGFVCGPLSEGREACVRTPNPETLPRAGDPCAASWCAPGLVCLRHRGETRCARSCADAACPVDQECVEARPSGRVCVALEGRPPRPPSVDAPADDDLPLMGQPCRIDGGAACAAGLVCVDTRVEGETVIHAGYCTQVCNPSTCCAPGWGCQPTGTGGRCRPFELDTEDLACEPRPAPEEQPHPEVGEGEGEGCHQYPAGTPVESWVLALLLVGRRRDECPESLIPVRAGGHGQRSSMRRCQLE